MLIAVAWQQAKLMVAWHEYMQEQDHWQGRDHDSYRTAAVDLAGFSRPCLKGWLGKHFHSLAGRALPAVVFGIVVWVGQIDSQRVPLLKALVQAD